VQTRIQQDDEPSRDQATILEMADRADRRRFDYALGEIQEDRAILIELFDADGIKSREPLRLTLAAVPDEAPQLSVRLRGIGSAITPEARLPVAGQILDDYGLNRVWFEYGIEDHEAGEVPIARPPGNQTDYQLDRALDGRQIDMAPGQRLILSVKASDRRDLDEGPNVGTSERWLLDVVTESELRTILESRELVLRQRFEAILAEVVESRDLLARIEFTGDGSDEPPPPPEQGGGEPDDERESDEAPSVERVLGLRKLRVERAVQNSRKDAHEILAVAVAFDEIRVELVNNRIDTEELKARLETGIAAPLRDVADRMYPELERRLGKLMDTLSEEGAARVSRDRAVAQVDTIVEAMNRVLARMIELEDFNEAIALLREIIEAQQRLNKETEQKHKAKLHDLLEDSP